MFSSRYQGHTVIHAALQGVHSHSRLDHNPFGLPTVVNPPSHNPHLAYTVGHIDGHNTGFNSGIATGEFLAQQAIAKQIADAKKKISDLYTELSKHRDEANSLFAQKKYDQAIAEANICIGLLENIKAAYSRSSINGVQTLNTAFENNTIKEMVETSQQLIADCHLGKNEFCLALELFRKLKSSATISDKIISDKIIATEGTIRILANDLLTSISIMNTTGNPDEIQKALLWLTQAENFLRSLNDLQNPTYLRETARIRWDEIRDEVTRDSIRLLEEKNILEARQNRDHSQLVGLLTDCLAEYPANDLLLNEAEVMNKSKLVSLLVVAKTALAREEERASNIANQKIINALLVSAEKSFIAHNFTETLSSLEECKTKAVAISEPIDVTEAKLSYTDPTLFESSIAMLRKHVAYVKFFNENYTAPEAEFAVEQILNEATRKHELYPPHAQGLKTALTALLNEKWYKVHARALPECLHNEISNFVKQHLHQLSTFGKYCYWTNADTVFESSIADFKAALATKLDIKIGAMSTNLLTLNLPAFPNLSQPNTGIEDMTQVIRKRISYVVNDCLPKGKLQDARQFLQICAKEAANLGDTELVGTISTIQAKLDKPKKVATEIIANAVAMKTAELGIRDRLYNPQKQHLEAALSAMLEKEMRNFSYGEFPETMIDAIGKIIRDNLKKSYCVARFFYWTDADVWFHDVIAVEQEIQNVIDSAVRNKLSNSSKAVAV